MPAISESGVPDALHREPGVAMVSALGRTAEGFAEIKRAVGQRAWAALYLGVPAAPEGGLIQRSWLDDWRLPAAPQRPVKTVVGVDPSDSGSGDSCGLIAASMTGDGVVAVIADHVGPDDERPVGHGRGEAGAERRRVRDRRRVVRRPRDLQPRRP